MPNGEKKGITVKIDADLHAEVRQYLEAHGMTMAEFVAQALDNELHPKYQMKENQEMGNMRTVAFQVPEDLFQRIKDYLQRNNMTQKQFLLGLIEQELERDQTERERLSADREDFAAEGEEVTDDEENAAVDESSAVCEDGENEDESEEYDEDESEDEAAGFSMQM